MSVTIQLRRDLAASWTSNNPILAQGEVGVEYDTGNLKVGNGTSTWTELSYSGLLASDAITWTAPQTFDAPITQTPGQGANNSTPFAQYGDLFSDAIMSGLTTTTSSTLSGTLAAGDAYVIGQRVAYPGSGYTVAASSTSYLDLSNTGQLAVSTSATVTANSLRLWQVTSSASAITGVTQVAPSGAVLTGPVSVPAAAANNEPVNAGQLVGNLGVSASNYNGSCTTLSSTTGTFTAPCNGKVLVFASGDNNNNTPTGSSLSASLSGLKSLISNYAFYSFYGYGELPMQAGQQSSFTFTTTLSTTGGMSNFLWCIWVPEPLGGA